MKGLEQVLYWFTRMKCTQNKIGLFSFSCVLALVLPLAPVIAMDAPPVADDAVVSLLEDPPTVDHIRGRWTEYLQGQGATKNQTAQVLAIWNQGDDEVLSRERLGKMVAAIAILHPETVLLAGATRRGDPERTEGRSWLEQEEIPAFLRDHLQLWVAQGWIQQGRYTQALALLEGISLPELLDPVSYAFALAAIHHQRADKKRGMQLLEWLREHQEVSPQRYAVLAELMYDDLQQLKAGSLDDISRRMKQIHQQLDLGRTGDHVLKTEDEVLRMLDKLIEEESQKQANQAAVAGQGGAPLRPAEASRPLGGKGSGQVTKKKIGQSTGWGDLPPKDREQAMQEISREFPAHYREVIEAYFRELARQQK